MKFSLEARWIKQLCGKTNKARDCGSLWGLWVNFGNRRQLPGCRKLHSWVIKQQENKLCERPAWVVEMDSSPVTPSDEKEAYLIPQPTLCGIMNIGLGQVIYIHTPAELWKLWNKECVFFKDPNVLVIL